MLKKSVNTSIAKVQKEKQHFFYEIPLVSMMSWKLFNKIQRIQQIIWVANGSRERIVSCRLDMSRLISSSLLHEA